MGIWRFEPKLGKWTKIAAAASDFVGFWSCSSVLARVFGRDKIKPPKKTKPFPAEQKFHDFHIKTPGNFQRNCHFLGLFCNQRNSYFGSWGRLSLRRRKKLTRLFQLVAATGCPKINVYFGWQPRGANWSIVLKRVIYFALAASKLKALRLFIAGKFT